MKKLIIIFSVLVSTLFAYTQLHTPNNTSKFDTTPYAELSKTSKKEVDCLALNMYREAGVEETHGMIAVALVTMNRLKSEKFPETVCKIVHQKKNTTCQFSWVCLNRLPRIDEKIYNYTRELATYVFLNYHLIKDITDGALFYHADYVNPRWKKLEVTTKIGRHIFYKPIGEI